MFAELLIFALNTPPAEAAPPPDARLQTVQAPPLDMLYLVEDHRHPIIWIELAFPTGDGSRWWAARQAEQLWSAGVGMALGDPASTASFRTWSTDIGFGLDIELLRDEQDLVVTDLQAVLRPDLGSQTVPLHRMARQARKGRRNSPTWLLECAIAKQFYHRRDPRRLRVALRGHKKVGAQEVSTLLQAAVRTPGAIVGFAGDITPTEALAFVEGELTVVGAGPREEMQEVTALRPLSQPNDRYVLVKTRGGSEALLGLARPGLDHADPRAPAALLAEEVGHRSSGRTVRVA